MNTSDNEDADIDSTAILTGFLFGNINESGQLEEDFLDEECRNRIGKLATFCGNGLFEEISDGGEMVGVGDDDDDGRNEEVIEKHDAAIDFSDFNEVVDPDEGEEERPSNRTPLAAANDTKLSDDDYDADEDGGVDGLEAKDSKNLSCVPAVAEPPIKPMMQTPLASMIPPELMNIDVRDLFPEFKQGVLRFGRMIPPAHPVNIWKKKKKKKVLEQDQKQLEAARKEAMQVARQVVDFTGRNVWKYGRSPTREEVDVDESELMMRTENAQNLSSEEKLQEVSDAAVWRLGPARMWYDMMGVPEDGRGFCYGFKLKQAAGEEAAADDTKEPTKRTSTDDTDAPEKKKQRKEILKEACQLVSASHWEDEIIRNSEDVKVKVTEEFEKKIPIAGWYPTSFTRSFREYIEKYHPQRPMELGYSLLPCQNDELVSMKCIADVIWDVQAMDRIPDPNVLTLNKNDENLILEVPDEMEVANREKQLLQQQQQQQESANPKKEKEMKKSKMASVKMKEEEEAQEENDMQRMNSINVSNEDYYFSKLTTDNALGGNLGVSTILHSTPAVELRQPFFPCHLSLLKLRNFHRPHLKKYSHGAMVSPGPHIVLSLVKHIRRKEKLREQERLASGGEIFSMRTPDDLTGRDGEIMLAEYSEQYPPLLNQIGMATKIKNFYKRTPGNYDSDPPQFAYGELAYAHTSPFLGSLKPGHSLQAFENNMFRAPIYPHKMPSSDFLVIRNRNNYYIREVEALFAVGQECPLMEVPNPASKRANTFLRDFLQLFIYRLFWLSRDSPRRIKMEEVRKAFPSHSESSIRKRLKLCADFKRTGIDSNWWVLKSNARLPSEEDLRAMVRPEQCSVYYSMLAAEQRLKDAGYGEKSLFATEEDNEEDSKMEDEVKAAPWSTTSAFISAMKGKCLLALNGVADPTGCGEGFSYVKIPNKPQPGRDDQSGQAAIKRSVMGTDADLRRLPLKEAKVLLRKMGVDEATVKKLGRWEVINQIRTMSTEQAKLSQNGGGICKFARGNKFSLADYQERYKEEKQRIFDLQNDILASDEVLSSEEDWSSAEESDLEEMGKNIEHMLSSKKTSAQLNLEREEAERKELNKMLKGDKSKKDKKGEPSSIPVPSGNRKLKITRKFRGEDGREYTRVEIVKKQNIIDKYIRIRESKDASCLQQFSMLDDQQKEEMKREKKRLQEQLRRIKRLEDGTSVGSDVKKKSSKSSKSLKATKLRCGACHQTGHMRTNRECPMFLKSSAPTGTVGNVALSEEQQEEMEKTDLKDEALINIEGTKVTLSKQLIKHAEDIKKKSLLLKLPKLSKEEKRRRLSSVSLQDDYLKKPKKSFNRRRADPVVTLSTIFEEILKEMRELPCSVQFLSPVNAKLVTDYYDIVQKPMCLQTIRENLRVRKYQSRESFIFDVSQIVKNCELYNGAGSPLTVAARQMIEHCLKRITEKDDKLMKLEKAINPLLDDDDMVSFTYILTSLIEERLKTVEGSVPFHTPVNKKQYKDYYTMIKFPMDLSTMHKKASDHQYFSRDDFLKDLYLLVSNCHTYNGPNNPLSLTASKLRETCLEAMEEQKETLVSLEQNILATREAAFDAVETDSIITGASLADDDHSKAPKFTIGDESSLLSAEDAVGRIEDDDDDDGDEFDRTKYHIDPHPFAAFGRVKTAESDMLSELQQELEISESSDSDDDRRGTPANRRGNSGQRRSNPWGGYGDVSLEDGEIADDSQCLPRDSRGTGDMRDEDMDVD